MSKLTSMERVEIVAAFGVVRSAELAIQYGVSVWTIRDLWRANGLSTAKPPNLIVDGAKRCSRCKEAKELSFFYASTEHAGGVASACKACTLEKTQRWYKENPDATSVKDRNRTLKSYSMTRDRYTEMLIEQQGVCAICGCEPTKRPLFVDHCHTTGRIRGLLCQGCNFALGFAKDDPVILASMISYLEKVETRQS